MSVNKKSSDKDISLDAEAIKKLIPHRSPFLFIDKLVNIIPLETATGIKKFSKEDYFFKGHFPEHPVVPGVVIIEALAQTAAALIAFSMREETNNKLVYLMSMNNCKFRKPVFPENVLELHVNATRSRGKVWKFTGVAKSNNSEVAEAAWAATIVDR